MDKYTDNQSTKSGSESKGATRGTSSKNSQATDTKKSNSKDATDCR